MIKNSKSYLKFNKKKLDNFFFSVLTYMISKCMKTDPDTITIKKKIRRRCINKQYYVTITTPKRINKPRLSYLSVLLLTMVKDKTELEVLLYFFFFCVKLKGKVLYIFVLSVIYWESSFVPRPPANSQTFRRLLLLPKSSLCNLFLLLSLNLLYIFKKYSCFSWSSKTQVTWV